MNFEPIGFFHCNKENPYEAARQGSVDSTFDDNSEGYVELQNGKNFEQGLDQLQTFSHLWLLFEFHHNHHWKPKVLPPRGSANKVGVFATRSPYRPNPIGMSCVRLRKIEGLKIFVDSYDLLDQTPILDIKPYLPYADCFPEANTGWIQSKIYQIHWSELTKSQLDFLHSHGVSELKGFIQNQLSEEPLNSKKKRLSTVSSPALESTELYILAYRTWRILFSVENESVHLQEIFSGYSKDDLQDISDKYQDKSLHREFITHQFLIKESIKT